MIKRTTSTIFALLLLLSCSGEVQAQSSAATEFHSRVVSVYSFQPHTLAKDALSIKSDEMDKFWSYVKANSSETLPLLRQELSSADNPSYFFYDGAKLLLTLSDSPDDRSLALRSVSTVDLRDVQATDYLTTIHWFAENGFDTREAAFHILSDPDFKAFIPQHALTLGQDYSFIYMLFPLANIDFEKDLIKHLASEQNPQSQKSLLLSLWYLITPGARAAIQNFSDKTEGHGEVAAYARELLARRSSFTLSMSSVASLRAQRSKIMRRPISDEALIEFDSLTMKMLAKQ